MVVVLPDPFDPSSPNVSPRFTSKLNLSITVVLPNFIVKFSMPIKLSPICIHLNTKNYVGRHLINANDYVVFLSENWSIIIL